MIGFFDSGLGGLTVLKEVVKLLPQYSYIYLGDNARAPYGHRSQEVIYKFTTEGVSKLFKRGAELVILACSTSSSGALRRIQQEFLPAYFPAKRVLGIIIPAAEEIDKFTRTSQVGVLATEATVNSLAYPKEIHKINPAIKVCQQACPMLVPLIEEGKVAGKVLDDAIDGYLDKLLGCSLEIDAIILGCTHYALIENQIKKHLPREIMLINQGPIVAAKLRAYLVYHPEVEAKISKKGERKFLSTENSEKVKALSASFYSEPIKLETVSL